MKKLLLFGLLGSGLLLAACGPAGEAEPTENLVYVTATPVVGTSADQPAEEPTEEAQPTDQPDATDEPADEPAATR